MGVIAWLVLGAFSGWIANRLMNSRTGLIDNIITGIIGSFIEDSFLTFLELKLLQVSISIVFLYL